MIHENAFYRRAQQFIESTDKFLIQDLRPGGIYNGIWCRDASYILRDWFLSGTNIDEILERLRLIWSHQIIANADEKVIYGRGSPEMNFTPVISNDRTKSKFEGSLPTSIFQENNVVEVFGKNPDIDSTALMISISSWILVKLLEKRVGDNIMASALSHLNKTPPLEGHSFSLTENAIDFLLPKMNKAISYLKSRDIDNDGLLEQDHKRCLIEPPVHGTN